MTKSNPAGRVVKPGINWVFYHAATKEDAYAWYEELTGSPIKPGYEWIVFQDHDGSWCFRRHR